MDEVPRICHHLAQKGHMSCDDITSLGFAGGREGRSYGIYDRTEMLFNGVWTWGNSIFFLGSREISLTAAVFVACVMRNLNYIIYWKNYHCIRLLLWTSQVAKVALCFCCLSHHFCFEDITTSRRYSCRFMFPSFRTTSTQIKPCLINLFFNEYWPCDKQINSCT